MYLCIWLCYVLVSKGHFSGYKWPFIHCVHPLQLEKQTKEAKHILAHMPLHCDIECLKPWQLFIYFFLSLKSQVCRLFSFIMTTLAFHSNEFKVAAVWRKEKGQRWRTTHSRFQCGRRREPRRHHQCVAVQYRAVGGWKERAVIVASSEAHLLDGDESNVLLSPAQMASCQHGPLNQAWHCLVALFPDIYEIPFISHGPILPAISAGDDLFL